MSKKPEDVLREWMLLVNKRDSDRILALYDESAVLIPTFSNRLLTKPRDIRDYFERLCGREGLSLTLHEKTLLVQPMKDDVCSLCGIYCWRFAIDGELLNFEARFSYLLNLALPKPILLHHSSQIPRML